MSKQKELNKNKALFILSVMVIGFCFIGFVVGAFWTSVEHQAILKSIQIENVIIEFNETQIVDAVYEKLNKSNGDTIP